MVKDRAVIRHVSKFADLKNWILSRSDFSSCAVSLNSLLFGFLHARLVWLFAVMLAQWVHPVFVNKHLRIWLLSPWRDFASLMVQLGRKTDSDWNDLNGQLNKIKGSLKHLLLLRQRKRWWHLQNLITKSKSRKNISSSSCLKKNPQNSG